MVWFPGAGKSLFLAVLKMKNDPIIIEQVYPAPIGKVWNAITDRSEMKQWYFDLAEFKPETGFEFSFLGGDDKQYVHLCQVTEVIQGKKLSYTWKYEGFEGCSEVVFELFDEGKATRLKLTHEGLETFPDNPDFARKNFVGGWTHITGVSLKDYLQ